MLALHFDTNVENDLLKMQSLKLTLEAYNAIILLAPFEFAANDHLLPSANAKAAQKEVVAHHLANTAPMEQ